MKTRDFYRRASGLIFLLSVVCLMFSCNILLVMTAVLTAVCLILSAASDTRRENETDETER